MEDGVSHVLLTAAHAFSDIGYSFVLSNILVHCVQWVSLGWMRCTVVMRFVSECTHGIMDGIFVALPVKIIVPRSATTGVGYVMFPNL